MKEIKSGCGFCVLKEPPKKLKIIKKLRILNSIFFLVFHKARPHPTLEKQNKEFQKKKKKKKNEKTLFSYKNKHHMASPQLMMLKWKVENNKEVFEYQQIVSTKRN